MKIQLARFVIVAAALATPAAHAEFTGDVKLACEALLCLSSGQRPDECEPPIRKYFSITARRISDTIKQRKDFLKLCPTASQDDNMKSLTDAIANGAGRCDAELLNRTLASTVTLNECSTTRRVNGQWVQTWTEVHSYDSDNMSNCRSREVTIIDNAAPAYCTIYSSNSNTYKIGATYVGDRINGGHWE